MVEILHQRLDQLSADECKTFMQKYYTMPSMIRIRGMPWYMMGWNHVLKRQDFVINKAPTWLMESYHLFGILGIVPLMLYLDNEGDWVLSPCNYRKKDYRKSGNSPLGRWPEGFEIVKCCQ